MQRGPRRRVQPHPLSRAPSSPAASPTLPALPRTVLPPGPGQQDVENIGYVVPVTVVRHFLEDIRRHGRYTGWCALGLGFCPLENRSFRDSLGLGPGRTGVMVSDVAPVGAAAGHLREGDVLLAVDGESPCSRPLLGGGRGGGLKRGGGS